jgi:hypothetical protein
MPSVTWGWFAFFLACNVASFWGYVARDWDYIYHAALQIQGLLGLVLFYVVRLSEGRRR